MKKPRSVRRAVLMSLFLQVVVFTIVYYGSLWALDTIGNGKILQGLLDSIGHQLYSTISFGRGRPVFILYAAILYALIVISLCIRAVLKVVRYVDVIDGSLGTILNRDAEVPDFPSDLWGVEVSIRDIRNEIYRNEQLAREAEQRKNDLVVYLAHDLKTPLTSVIGYLTLLKEAPDIPIAQRAKYTAITLDKAYRLEQLINEFFDITRFNLQSITLENNRIDLTLMLRQMIEEFYPIFAEKDLAAGLDIERGITLIGDAGKLERVFDNLLRNAVSYSYPGTRIMIATKKDGENVRISFRNTGDEIPPQRLTRVFEKFFRTDIARGTRTGGAGLGLAIAKQIVELHGGTISAVSSREFTEFTIVLPTRPS